MARALSVMVFPAAFPNLASEDFPLHQGYLENFVYICLAKYLKIKYNKMKKIYIIILISLTNFSYSQDPRLFDNYWYLTNIVENGVANIPPTSTMGISFDSQMLIAHACLDLAATVTFENNTTNFSATNFAYCLCWCTNPVAESYENNKYFPFLNHLNGNPATISNFTYTITELQGGAKSLIINSEFNSQAIYSSVPLSNAHFEKFDFSIYPNPSQDAVTIQLINEYATDSMVEFYNEIGIICKSEKITSTNYRIDTKELASGVYFVKIKTDAETLVKKLIKK